MRWKFRGCPQAQHWSGHEVDGMQPQTTDTPSSPATPVIGIVAFSFANRGPEAEPNPCNVRLAEVVRRWASPGAVIVAQWEVARSLRAEGIDVDHVVEPPRDGSYLDSDAVWLAARRVFHDRGVIQVIPVAQPFLQRAKVKEFIRRDGFEVVARPVGWIGFDRSRRNLQWWTRGPLRLVVYSGLRATRAHRGPLRGARGAG